MKKLISFLVTLFAGAALAAGPFPIPNAQITGGTISGLSAPIPISSGGTGATTATGSGIPVLSNAPTFSGTITSGDRVVVNHATASTPDSANIGAGFNIASQNEMYFGGSSTTGGRIAVNGITYNSGGATSASNTNRNYVGVVGQAHAFASDGGTNLTTDARGAFFGLNGIAYADPSATNLLGVVAQENDTFSQTGSSFKYQSGLNIVGYNAVRGSVVDAAVMVGGSTQAPYGPHIGWKCGVCFTDFNGNDPMYSGSTLLGYVWQTNPATKRSITNGIDMSGFNISGAVIQSQNLVLTDNSLQLGANGANISAISAGNGVSAANLDLNAKGGGSIRLANTVTTNVVVGPGSDNGVNRLQIIGSLTASGGVQLPLTTVSSLPTCNAGAKGTMYAVSDATAPTYNGALTGGGAVSIPVYCNGSAWTAH